MLSYIPKEPLPDMGDKIVSGVNSRGIPKKSAMGDKNEHKICNAPDAFSISITVISAMRKILKRRASGRLHMPKLAKAEQVYTYIIFTLVIQKLLVECMTITLRLRYSLVRAR